MAKFIIFSPYNKEMFGTGYGPSARRGNPNQHGDGCELRANAEEIAR